MKHITLILLILVVRNGGAQAQTFSLLTKFDANNILLGSINETATNYWTLGKGYDTIGNFLVTHYYLASFNKEGSYVHKMRGRSPFADLNPLKAVFKNDTILFTGGGGNGMIALFQTTLDTFILKPIPNPYPNGTGMYLAQGLIESNGSYTTIGFITPDTLISIGSQTFITHLDSNFNTIWSRHYHATGDTEGANAFIKTAAGNYVVLSSHVGGNSGADITNVVLYEVNPQGYLVRRYDGDAQYQELGADLIVASDASGYLYCGQGQGVRRLSGSYYYAHYKGCVTKLNNMLEKEWQLNLYPYDFVTLNKLAPTNDGNYVVAGSYGFLGGDTLDYSATPPIGGDSNGFLLKFTPQGDSLWGRFYKKIVSPYDEHYLYDVKQTSDGGFILCGEGRDIIVGNPYRGQWGWIVKTDTFGCVVPGCQLTDGLATVPNGLGEALRLAPNPTSSDLWFQLSAMASSTLNLSISDMQGRLIEQHTLKGFMPQVQYQLSVAHLPKGVYVLSLSDGKGGLWAEKFVVN